MKNLAFVLVIAACGSNAPAPTPLAPSAGPSAVASGATGKVVERTFHSDALGVDKHYLVYLPIGYDDKPTAKWPVLKHFAYETYIVKDLIADVDAH